MDTAIIAGVGPGLGSSLAQAFARQGLAIALLSRRPESSESVAQKVRSHGAPALVVPTDVGNPQDVKSAVEAIRSQFGPITVLAYNAGGYGRGPFLELDAKTFQQSFQVGVMGAVHLAQAVIPGMLEAGHGFISFTGATAARRGRAGFAPLSIAKAGVRMLAQSLAREFHPQGIHVVHIIVDGQIDTPKLRAREPQRAAETMIAPDAIASSIIHTFRQPPNGWSHEIDIRPNMERF
ncbi:MAG: SDR family NAD(P)-dependent oxidoreductase [Alphaproteobacteria bacterium]